MSTCCKCGAQNPRVHLTQIMNGVVKKSDYCEPCFEQTELKASVKTAKPYNEAEWRATLEQIKQRKRITFSDKMKEIRERDVRFSPEAFDFVQKSLNRALKSIQPHGHSRHVTARELVEASQLEAREAWGTSAKTQLMLWGIKTSSDIGDIVFLLIDAGVLGRRPEDNRSDFDDLPFLND